MQQRALLIRLGPGGVAAHGERSVTVSAVINRSIHGASDSVCRANAAAVRHLSLGRCLRRPQVTLHWRRRSSDGQGVRERVTDIAGPLCFVDGAESRLTVRTGRASEQMNEPDRTSLISPRPDVRRREQPRDARRRIDRIYGVLLGSQMPSEKERLFVKVDH